MKKNDIKAGVVYAYAETTDALYRSARPLIVLDAKGLWTWSRPARGTQQHFKVSGETRYTKPWNSFSSYSGPHGYLVLQGSSYDDIPKMDAHLELMKSLYAEFAATAGNPDAVHALVERVQDMDFWVNVVNNRWIVGDYTEAKNEEEEAFKTRQAKNKAERDRSDAERALMNQMSEIIGTKLERTVSIHSDRTWGYTRASIKVEDLAEFLGIVTRKEEL